MFTQRVRGGWRDGFLLGAVRWGVAFYKTGDRRREEILDCAPFLRQDKREDRLENGRQLSRRDAGGTKR